MSLAVVAIPISSLFDKNNKFVRNILPIHCVIPDGKSIVVVHHNLDIMFHQYNQHFIHHTIDLVVWDAAK